MSIFCTDDEDRTAQAVALIISATHDAEFTPSLTEIYTELCQNESPDLLDPLNMIPSLVGSTDRAAFDLLMLIGERASAKEVVMGVQEAVEKLKHNLASEEFDDEQANPQLLTLLRVYATAVPRVLHRKKSPREVLLSIVTDLASTMSLAGPHAAKEDGRAIIVATADFAQKARAWAFTKPDLQSDDRPEALLKSLLDSTITAYSHSVRSSLAARTFARCYPRLSFQVKLEPGWEAGQDAMKQALATYSLLGVPPQFLVAFPSACHFVLIAHVEDDSVKTLQTLSSMLGSIVGFIQANNALDETLSFLLETLHLNKATLSPETSIPLCTVLPPFASGHPNPSVRHQAFRILSKVLSSTDAAMRLQILQDLCTHSDFPQMRVAAVGLVKEAIIEAFSSQTTSLFSSPRFLQVLGPILFRSCPPEFFEKEHTLEDLRESSEPARLVECLGLLYVLFVRDEKNKTGIRDRDNLKNIRQQLLGPMAAMLTKMLGDPEIQKVHAHDIMPLVSLQTVLDRVEGAFTRCGFAEFD